MNIGEIVVGFTVMMLCALAIGYSMGQEFGTCKVVRQSIEQCETELPRNQTCEAVITAKPKESSHE